MIRNPWDVPCRAKGCGMAVGERCEDKRPKEHRREPWKGYHVVRLNDMLKAKKEARRWQDWVNGEPIR